MSAKVLACRPNETQARRPEGISRSRWLVHGWQHADGMQMARTTCRKRTPETASVQTPASNFYVGSRSRGHGTRSRMLVERSGDYMTHYAPSLLARISTKPVRVGTTTVYTTLLIHRLEHSDSSIPSIEPPRTTCPKHQQHETAALPAPAPTMSFDGNNRLTTPQRRRDKRNLPL